jgi:hypothetical protein
MIGSEDERLRSEFEEWKSGLTPYDLEEKGWDLEKWKREIHEYDDDHPRLRGTMSDLASSSSLWNRRLMDVTGEDEYDFLMGIPEDRRSDWEKFSAEWGRTHPGDSEEAPPTGTISTSTGVPSTSTGVPSTPGVVGGDAGDIADPPDPYDWLDGPGALSSPGLDLNARAGTVARRAWDEAKSQQEELRRQTPEELAQDEYWGTRAQDARDDARSRLYADVAGAISGSGGVRGNIGKGLKEAIYGQIEQMDLARDFEGLPITAAATRSRGSTFEAQQRVLESVYTALTSRGETNALIEGRLDEIQDSLAQAGRMTPDNMVKFQSVLMWMEERDLISEEGMKKAVRELGALGAAAAGMSPLIFQ